MIGIGTGIGIGLLNRVLNGTPVTPPVVPSGSVEFNSQPLEFNGGYVIFNGGE